MSLNLIGLCGVKRSGKDTAGYYFIDNHKYVKYAFADPFKKACKEIFMFNKDQIDGNLKESIDDRWNISSRKVFQRFGTEIFRDSLQDFFPEIDVCDKNDFWIYRFKLWYNEQKKNNPNIKVVVTDVRFENEAGIIKKLGGKLIKINRSDINNEDTHISETSINNIKADYNIDNNSSISDYYQKLEDIYYSYNNNNNNTKRKNILSPPPSKKRKLKDDSSIISDNSNILFLDFTSLFNMKKNEKNEKNISTENNTEIIEINENKNTSIFNNTKPEKYLSSNDYKLLNSISGLIKLCDKSINYNNKDLLKLSKIKNELIEMNNLIGMDNIKEIICNQIFYLIQNKNDDYLHTVLFGNPGCGKTTIAKILGKIFLKLGYLSNSKFIIAKRSDLIAGYLGQTAMKTQKIIDKANGGVLFIDEVYSLGSSKKNDDSFSKECIDTLNQNLSENKNFICIIAGYEDEVKKYFFSKNKGLERRFPWIYKIEQVNHKQLYHIFLKIIQRNSWSFNKKDLIELSLFFQKNYKDFPYGGGSLENFFTKIKINYYKLRFGRKKNNRKNVININDIKESFNIYKLYENKTSIELKPPPPGMYI